MNQRFTRLRRVVILIFLCMTVLGVGIGIGIGHAQDSSQGVPGVPKTPGTLMQPWVYQAMGFLQQKGVILEYPFEWVNSGNQLSRFEIAYYIKGFIIKQPTAKELPTTTIEVLQKLIAEFRTELTDLGIQITDIYKVSPNLATLDTKVNDYQDLDTILLRNVAATPQPFYYFGQYFNNFQKKSFVFIPDDYVESNYMVLINTADTGINLIYPSKIGNDPSFLVMRGYLPVADKKTLMGYYLFPIEEFQTGLDVTGKYDDSKLNELVLALLDEVNQLQQLDSLWRFNGVLPLNDYLAMKTDLTAKSLAGSLNQGLKIGGLLIYTESPANRKNSLEVNNFGMPFYNPRLVTPAMPIDLDAINDKNLQSIQINILGSLALTPQASLYGGVDMLYRGTNTGLESPWPSDTKASAGINYHFNDYWTVLTYQSFVNSHLQTGLLSTTSIGVDYNSWVTLWLAYQLVNFDNPVFSGTVSLRF
jgi:hypothetical protein